MDGLVVGIDCGTQSAKVGIFDNDGVLRAWAQRRLRPMHRPAPGVVVHPEDDVWDTVAAACREAVTSLVDSGGDPARIEAVGVCTIRCCKAFLDAEGRLVEPLISWMDDRAYRAYHPSDPATRWATTSSGYVMVRLTGGRCDTSANCIDLQWPIDNATWQWSADDGSERYGVSREELFELDAPGTIGGTLSREAAAATGLPHGVAVVHTANDKAVEHLGCGPTGEDTALLSLGTYICAMTTGTADASRQHSWSNFSCIPGTWLVESNGVRRGMWTLTWLLDLVGPELVEHAAAQGVSRESILEAEAATAPAGSDGLLTVLDWLAPTDHPYRKGMMIGFDARHTRGHLYRSVMEAIAMTMAENTGAMMHELDRTLSQVVVSGGGAASPLFASIVADTFGVPVDVVDETASPAARGAAICASAALRSLPLTDVRDDWAPPRRRVDPDAARTAIYRPLGEFVTERIRSATDPILRALAGLEKGPR